MSNTAAAVAVASGLIALVVHYLLVPFDAAAGNGLLNNGTDLLVYRMGGSSVLHGQGLYTLNGGWFTYPPFAAMLSAVFNLAPFQVAKYVWFAVSFGALASTVWRCLRVSGFRRDGRLGWFCLGLSLAAVQIEPVRGALAWGQVVLVLMAMVVWDLTRPPGARWRGWSVGVATGIKLTAVVFVPYLLVTRQWRAAMTSVGVAIATVAVGFLVRPSDSREYWLHAAYQIHHVGNPDDVGNWSINGVLANLFAPQSVPGWLWFVAAVAAGMVGLAAASAAHRQGRTLLAVTIMGWVSCVTSPLAWAHQWVWFAPLLILLLVDAMHARSDGRPAGVRVAITVAVAGLTAMWADVWTYIRMQQLDITHFMAYSKLDIAVGHERWMRILVCGLPLLIYTAVAVAALVHYRNSRRTTAEIQLGGPHA